MKDAHPLVTGLIEEVSPDPYPLTPTDERLQRLARGAPGRALPTARTASNHPAWKWGRSVERQPTKGPVIMSPTDLLPGGDKEQSSRHGDFNELLTRWRGR